MKIPELNPIQRVLLVAAAGVILAISANEGFRDGYMLHLIVPTALLLIAFSGGIEILIPTIVKTLVSSALVISLMINAVMLTDRHRLAKSEDEWKAAWNQKNFPLAAINRQLTDENTKIIHENNLLRAGKGLSRKYKTQDEKFDSAIDEIVNKSRNH